MLLEKKGNYYSSPKEKKTFMAVRSQYCCNLEFYEDCFLLQSESGMPYFSGMLYQRGYGMSNIFASLGRAVLPLVKRGAKAGGGRF